jgi:YidC/Oxa1 family membrane protein insertase
MFSGLIGFFGTLFAPIGQAFHLLFFEPVFNILILIYHGVGNFALAIVLLTLVIRGALYPLTRHQLASTRKMQELAPRVKEIQAKYRGNPQEAMAAQQALYKEHGVSMYGGCLPMVIQMPFIYALFYSFEALLDNSKHALVHINEQIYPFLPPLNKLPLTHFLWTDLKSPDPLYILPILAGVLTFIQLRMAAPVKRPGAPVDPTTDMTRRMQWIMPFFTAFIGTRFASGLALYWTVSTGFSAAQQYVLTGWGSLFVGVPGMERFVPPPKELAPVTPTPTRGTPGSTPGGAAQAAAQQPPQGFMATIRDMYQQAREQMTQTQTQAQEQNGGPRVVEAGAGSGAMVNGGEAAKPAAPGQSRPRDKKPRPNKPSVTLVRPESSTASERDQAAQMTDDLPENRIKRDMLAPMNGIIGDEGDRLNGGASQPKGAVNGTGMKANGVGKPAAAPRPGGGSSSSGQRKSPQARRKGQKGSR